MWIRIKILGNREYQKSEHKSLRNYIRNLVQSGAISGFVMTYHVKHQPTDSLHLCMNVPSLTSCTLDSLRAKTSFRPFIEHLGPLTEDNKAIADDYLFQTCRGQKKELSKYGVSSDPEGIETLARKAIDNAWRGCDTALQVLFREIHVDANPLRFYETILGECKPLNRDLTVSDSAHFCFNSLGFSPREEESFRIIHNNQSALIASCVAEGAMRRLFNREGWKKPT